MSEREHGAVELTEYLPPEKASLQGLAFRERDRLHWLTMLLELPEKGVRRAFPDEAVCCERLMVARWPKGITCVRCQGSKVLALPNRGLLHCSTCRAQFTVTSGTALHRSRLPIQMWMLATEDIIQTRAISFGRFDSSVRHVASQLGIHNEAALRLRTIVLDDIRMGGNGLLRRAVCAKNVLPPDPIQPDSKEHLDWVVNQSLNIK